MTIFIKGKTKWSECNSLQMKLAYVLTLGNMSSICSTLDCTEHLTFCNQTISFPPSVSVLVCTTCLPLDIATNTIGKVIIGEENYKL